MSDMPKGLQGTVTLNWSLLGLALLLTVVAGWLGWIEVAEEKGPAPRSFVWGGAMVVWTAFIILSCTLLVLRKVLKKIERCKVQVLEALADQRFEHLDEMIQGSNVRSIYRKG